MLLQKTVSLRHMAQAITSSCYSTLGRGVVGNAVLNVPPNPQVTERFAEMGQNLGVSCVYGHLG